MFALNILKRGFWESWAVNKEPWLASVTIHAIQRGILEKEHRG